MPKVTDGLKSKVFEIAGVKNRKKKLEINGKSRCNCKE
jgi:hypothetical protein